MIRKIYGVCIIVVLVVGMFACACSCKKKEEPSINMTASQGSPGVETEASPSQIGVPPETSAPVAKVVGKETTQVQETLPRLLDLGADKCIPCKMMAPILEEMKEEYAGRLKIEFIDVWKNPRAAKQYGIRIIPTQIFYDMDGKEFKRHEGFMAKETILSTFREKGVDLSER